MCDVLILKMLHPAGVWFECVQNKIIDIVLNYETDWSIAFI